MRVQCTSKSAVEEGSKERRLMTHMVYFVFLGPDGGPCSSPFGTLVIMEDFERYQVGEIYEIK